MALIIQADPWQNANTLKKIVTITFTGNMANIKLEPHARNRILNPEIKLNTNTTDVPLSKNNQDNFIHISFKNLKFEEDEDGQITKNYIKNILTNGIVLARKHFIFCGHSNSQLRNRTCFMMAARRNDSHEYVADMINHFANFASINDVRKRAKRIGLAFTSSDQIVHLEAMDCTVIDDVVVQGRNFTDGCGIISQEFAKEIYKRHYLRLSQGGLNREYNPSVFQIRYQGVKGTLVVVNKIIEYVGNSSAEKKVAFRPSMLKFDGCSSEELYVLGFSMPSGPGYLNSELVSLLSSLGVPDNIFETRLEEYFHFILQLGENKDTAIRYFQEKGFLKILKELKENGHPKHEFHRSEEWLHQQIRGIQCHELRTCFDKNDIERVHIRIPLSRLLYGVCDISGKLKEGQCFVQYTLDKETLRTLTVKGPIVVGRNPCFHPGDIRIFTAVDIPELSNLRDCIVFPSVGMIPAASQMSGGDLDGDKFFVCWDRDLLPPKCTDPFDYSTIESKPLIPFVHQNQQLDLIDYFVESNNSTLGALAALYWDWIRVRESRAFSQECLAVNTLYSRCVDGDDFRIPEYLMNPPTTRTESPFILDTLVKKVQELLEPHGDLLETEITTGSESYFNGLDGTSTVGEESDFSGWDF